MYMYSKMSLLLFSRSATPYARPSFKKKIHCFMLVRSYRYLRNDKRFIMRMHRTFVYKGAEVQLAILAAHFSTALSNLISSMSISADPLLK